MARKELTENEVLLRNLVKAKTGEIRMRHSLAADREVMATLPGLETDFWRAVQLGVQREFAAGEVNAAYFGDQPVVTIDDVGPLELSAEENEQRLFEEGEDEV